MSRWKSPQTGAKRAERAHREAEQRHREKRTTWILVIGFALIAVGLIVADFFWLRSQARQRHEGGHRHDQLQTNNSILLDQGKQHPARAGQTQE